MKQTDTQKALGFETGAKPSRWLVDRWLPRGRAGLLIGVPGVGKELLAVALAAGVAGDGGDWLGGAPEGRLVRRPRIVVRGPAVYASWDEEPSEIEDRVRDRGFEPPADFFAVGLADAGPLWAPKRAGVLEPSGLTDAGRRLRLRCEERGTVLLVFDTLSAAYYSYGAERAFMMSWDAWAGRTGCAVLAIADSPLESWDWDASSGFAHILETEMMGGVLDPEHPERAWGSLRWSVAKSAFGRAPVPVHLSRRGGGARQTYPPNM